jgi:SynChlorMet cassette radical SAM/SPASM protein ScmF
LYEWLPGGCLVHDWELDRWADGHLLARGGLRVSDTWSAAGVPPLRTIYFYITNSCNLACAHCWLSKEGHKSRGEELTTGEIASIMDQALPLGLESIKITGGEPLLRDDIADIVAHADELGLSTRIESNGMLLDEARARALGESRGLQHVAVSLDGATPESHAMLRGSRSSFDRAVRGIERLVAHGVSVQIISCLHRGNLDEMADLTALAARLGVASFKINPITHLGRGQEMAERGQLLTVAEVLDVSRQLDNGLGQENGIPVHMTLPVAFLSLKAIRRQGLDSCGVMNLLGVLPNGDLSICGIGEAYGGLIFGQARRTPIREVWETSPGLARIRAEIRRWPTGLCQRCLMRGHCVWGSCRAEAHALSGSLSAPAPFCQAAFEEGLFPAGRQLG